MIMAILGAIVLFKSLTIESEDGGDRSAASPGSRCFIIVARSAICCGVPLLGIGLRHDHRGPLLIFISSLAGDEFHWRACSSPSVADVGSWLFFSWASS